MTDDARLLSRTTELATGYLASLATRRVGGPVDLPALRAAMGGPLPEGPTDPVTVVEGVGRSGRPGARGNCRPALLRVRRSVAACPPPSAPTG